MARGGSRTAGRGAAVAVFVALGVVSTSLVSTPAVGEPRSAAPAVGVPGTPDVPVATTPLKVTGTPRAPMPSWRPPAPVAKPTTGSVSVAVGTRLVQAGTSPVAVAAVPARRTTGASAATSSPRSIRVTTLDEKTASSLGGQGFAVALQRSDAGATAAPVQVALDYSFLASRFGGDIASRLQVQVLPACALTTPQRPECLRGQPVAARRDTAGQQLVTTIQVAGDPSAVQPAASSFAKRTGPVGTAAKAVSAAPVAQTTTASVVTLTTEASGPTGNWAATPLKPSMAWDVGLQSGSFTYSYPLPAVAPIGGSAPSLALGYNSGSVDGLSAADNTQASPVGIGWELNAPFIERRYKACTGALAGNLCWSSDNASIVLNGKSSLLVPDADGAWHLSDDPGWKVQRVYASNNGNGDSDGEYWKVTDLKGTQYWFGKEQYSDASVRTHSALTVPVYATEAGQPCYSNANRVCQQTWRWNLSHVIDTNQNLQTWYWSKQTSSYSVTPSAAVQRYHSAGYLTQVQYGHRTPDAANEAPYRVVLQYTGRCNPANTSTCPFPTQATSANYPDIPFDQWCSETATSCTAGPRQPVFFYLNRLDSAVSQVWNGGDWNYVDRVDLRHSFPSSGETGVAPALYLSGVKRTGMDGGGASSLPEVVFNGVSKPNRFDTGSSARALNKWRVDDIITELGGHIRVTYGTPNACSSAMYANADTQTTNCFPRWTKNDDSVGFGWFYKYVVTNVKVQDRYGAPEQSTGYAYLDAPAWHSDNDPFAPTSQQSWGDWRGYGKVKVVRGAAASQTWDEYLYYRGMHGDHLANGTTRVVNVVTHGTAEDPAISTVDHYYLKGLLRQHRRLDSDGSPEFDEKQYGYWSKQTATGSPGPYGISQRNARMVRQDLAISHLTQGGTARDHEQTVRTSFDDTYGLPMSVQNGADPISGVATTCTITTYAANATEWIIDVPRYTSTWSGVCPAGAGTEPSTTRLTRKDVFYDANFNSQWVAATAGNPTRTREWRSGSDSVNAAISYDAYGRVTGTVSPNNFVPTATTFATAGTKATTAYTQPAERPVSRITKTDESGAVTATDVNPGRGLPTTVTDPNNKVTTATYDTLGQLLSVRKPGDSYDSLSFSYNWSSTAASSIRSNTYASSTASAVSSWQFFDALGRPFQKQSAAPSGSGMIVSGVRYNNRGNTGTEVPAYAGSSAPGSVIDWYGATIVAAIPSATVYGYDALDRVTSKTLMGANTTTIATTTTAYNGPNTVVTPPSNSGSGQADVHPSTTVTDFAGRNVKTMQTNLTALTNAFDALGRVTQTVTTPGNATTTHVYDWTGNRTSTTDPDAGTSTSTYYPGGQVKTARSATGADVFSALDVLGRTTDTYAGTSTSGALLSRSVYDGIPLGATTALKGTVTSQTSYVGSVAGTPGAAYRQAFGFDARYRATRLDQTLPTAAGTGLAGTYSTTTTYDGMDRPTSVTYPAAGGLAAETVTTGYNGAFPTTLTSPTTTYVSATGYSNIGEITSRVMGTAGTTGSLHRAYTRNAATGRLTTQTATSPAPTSGTPSANVQNDAYTYNPVGDVTVIHDQVAGQRQCFTYDSYDRLTAANTTDSTSTCTYTSTGTAPYTSGYTYDLTGNLTQRTHNGATTTYAYGSRTVSGTALTGGPHAATTMTTGSTVNTYSYDASGRLTSRNIAGTASTLAYDPLGRLATVTTGTQSTNMVYGPDGSRWLRKTPTDTVAYLAGQELRLASGATTPAATRYYTHSGAQIAIRKSSGMNWTLGDRQGSTSISVNASTGVSTRDRYLPYGGNRGTTSTLPSEKGWLNQTRDDTTGLIYLNARYYDSTLARFIAADPLTLSETPQATNPYAYSGNNPVTFMDPSGLLRSGGQCGPDNINCPGTEVDRKRDPAKDRGPASHRDGERRGSPQGAPAPTRAAKSGNPFLDIVRGVAEPVYDGVYATITIPLSDALCACPELTDPLDEQNARLRRFFIEFGGGSAESDYYKIPSATVAGVSGAVGPRKWRDILNDPLKVNNPAAKQIADGHAYEKHVVERGEFPGVQTRQQFAAVIDDVVANGEMRPLTNGRTAYWRGTVVVIRNPNASDGGTAFAPKNGYDYFLGLS